MSHFFFIQRFFMSHFVLFGHTFVTFLSHLNCHINILGAFPPFYMSHFHSIWSHFCHIFTIFMQFLYVTFSLYLVTFMSHFHSFCHIYVTFMSHFHCLWSHFAYNIELEWAMFSTWATPSLKRKQ